MKFNPYSSIENTYRQKYIDYLYQTGLNGGVWTVSEKLHGANFSIVSDGTVCRMAKKTALIADDNNFYGCQALKEELYRQALEIFKKLNTDMGITYLKLCGEIYGGCYPHPDVERAAGAVKVQNKVWYRPDNGFYGFDIVADETYLNQKIVEILFKEVGVFYAEPLFEGTFEDCLAYPNDFISTIPPKFNLPEIKDNICEGVVIKPIEPAFFACGSRVIFKNKNPKFSEKKNGRIPKEKMVEVKFDEDTQKLYDELVSLITENRLRNVISHIGKISDKEFGKLMGLFVKDALEEFLKDNQEAFDALEKDVRKRITKLVSQIAADTIRPNFLNIIDGVY